MLSSVGYRCYVPSKDLKAQLRTLGCDNVSDIDHLVRHEGYEQPKFVIGDRVQADSRSDLALQVQELDIPEAYPADMLSCDLYVDVKAHRNGPKVWTKWPRLRDRTLWYRINGGKPEHVVNARGDMGDEVDPPCPVLTPNQWYKDKKYLFSGGDCDVDSCDRFGGSEPCIAGQPNTAYACWPPFVRFEEYDYPRPYADVEHESRAFRARYTSPMCLVHNFRGWGYGALLEVAQELGVRVHGVGSPDGLLQHREVRVQLSDCLAYVHLKSSDAPGYALYEALSAACPVICTRRLIWKNRMEDLLVPGETCYVFDRPTHDPICAEEVAEVREELGAAIRALSSSQENRRVGENGRKKLKELMWSKDKEEDVSSLRNFFTRNFGE